MAARLVIVGAGMAAAYLLQELERQPHDLEIIVIGDELEACYNRVLLSNVLAGENTESDLEMLNPFPGAATQIVTGTRALTIDSSAHTVSCDNGSDYYFDKLVIATGARVARPTVDLSGIDGVRIFRTLRDVRELRALAGHGRNAVVLGAGLLGLEAAHGLNSLGFATRVVHRNPVIMNRQLDIEGGALLQRDLEERGIGFQLNSQLAALETDAAGHVRAVHLDSDERLECDLLVLATGIVPATALATESGIATDRGILVDEYLHTSVPEIYAIGECSQFGDTCFGLVAPIREQASVLAANLAGKTVLPFRLRDYPTQLKISGVEIYRAGELDDEAEQLVLRGKGVYRRLVVRDNRLVGAVLVGDKRGGNWYSQLISEGRDIESLRDRLMFGRAVREAVAMAA